MFSFSSGSRRWRCHAAVTLLGSSAILLAAGPPAYAIYHQWDGYRYAGNRLTDPGSSQPWHYGVYSSGAPTGTTCIKGQIPPAGGIYSFVCSTAAVASGKRCDVGGTSLQAYVYGNGYSGPAQMVGQVDTTGPC